MAPMPSLSTQLNVKQQQRLVMTPMLLQALKILQMNSIELGELIQHELGENPLLEELPEAERPVDEEPAEAAPEPASDDWQDYFEDNGLDFRGSAEPGAGGGAGGDALQNVAADGPSLQEHLLSQLDSEEPGPELRRLMEELVGRINERGYLDEDLAEIASQTGAERGALFDALRRLQGLDPVGVGARDLRECLLLQMEAKGMQGSLAWNLVSEHLSDLEHRRYESIQKRLKVGLEDLREAEAAIATLEPIPGRPFGVQANPAVQVEAFVEKSPDGTWQVRVNDRDLPRLGFNAYYRRLMKAPGGEGEDAKRWLKERYESALWLIRGIEQRKRTLRRVLEEIVAVQAGFLELGAAGFQPLTLKDIAQKTGLHESTVSRVTSGKYVQTPRGVFELKYFFSSGLKTESGEDASSMSVKQAIREFLDEEDRRKPMSDQQIAKALEARGIHIARRTVAKYREELRLPSAHARKEGR